MGELPAMATGVCAGWPPFAAPGSTHWLQLLLLLLLPCELSGCRSCPAGGQLLSKRRCPNALQIMRDPVMLATGQT